MELKDIIKSLEEECDELMGEINKYDVTQSEAEELSTKFLTTNYRVNRVLRKIRNELIKLEIQKDTAYGNAFKGMDQKINVSKQKATATANPEYMKANAMLRKMENTKEYFKGVYALFENGHKFYKSLMRD